MPSPWIHSLTHSFRSSNEKIFTECRAIVSGRGLDPESVLLLDHYPDDATIERFYLLTAEHRIIVLDVDFLSDGSARESYWNDETETLRERFQTELEP